MHKKEPNWEKLYYHYIGLAMEGLCANTTILSTEIIAKTAIEQAKTVINKLKEEYNTFEKIKLDARIITGKRLKNK